MLGMEVGQRCMVVEEIRLSLTASIPVGTMLVYDGERTDHHSTTGVSFEFHVQHKPNEVFNLFGFTVEEKTHAI